MIRCLPLLLVAAASSSSAAGLPRSFTISSFDRVRIEGDYVVSLVTNRAPFARAEGNAADLDAIDLRVEGRTLVLRQRSNRGGDGSGPPVRIALGTPDIRSATLAGAGSLRIDRMGGLSADVAVQGPGQVSVEDVQADRLTAGIQGSGSLTLGGKVKSASLVARGTAVLAATGLAADEVTVAAEGGSQVEVRALSRAAVTAAGPVQVRLLGKPACTLRVSGSASVTGCGIRR